MIKTVICFIKSSAISFSRDDESSCVNQNYKIKWHSIQNHHVKFYRGSMCSKTDSAHQVCMFNPQLIQPSSFERILSDFTVSVWIQMSEKLNNSTFT
jgi:hypothetical protein